jgi:pimeloyl-ACP methyl ester carboxylesterase
LISLFYAQTFHMLSKRIPLSGHEVQIAPVFPRNRVRDDIFVLFLHEALGSIGQWRNFPQLLCDALGMPGFMYERQGHGASDPLNGTRDKNYLHHYAWQELPEVIRTLIPAGKKVLLVGHSDGGTIALLYASKFPKQVAGIVTMAAHIFVEDETLAGIHPAIEAYHAGKLAGLQKYHGPQTETLFFAWANTWLHPDFRDWNIEADIQEISCPALIIQGKNDQYGTAMQVETIARLIAGSHAHILGGCNHHPHLEKTTETVVLISQWWMDHGSDQP